MLVKFIRTYDCCKNATGLDKITSDMDKAIVCKQLTNRVAPRSMVIVISLEGDITCVRFFLQQPLWLLLVAFQLLQPSTSAAHTCLITQSTRPFFELVLTHMSKFMMQVKLFSWNYFFTALETKNDIFLGTHFNA